jgi:hypothetical protein
MEYITIQCVESQEMFRKNIAFIFRLEEWNAQETSMKQAAPPKQRFTFNGLHGVIFKKIKLFFASWF